jgi:hypothetical protein
MLEIVMGTRPAEPGIEYRAGDGRLQSGTR